MSGYLDTRLRIDLLTTGNLFRFPDQDDIYAICDQSEWETNPLHVIAVNRKFELIRVRPWRSIIPLNREALNARLVKTNPWMAGMDEMKGTNGKTREVSAEENGPPCSLGTLPEPGFPPF